MLASSFHDSRPTKRSRNWAEPDPPPSLIPPTQQEDSSNSTVMQSKVQDKDKNRKLSCKECRRLKLRCDRIFPCQSCVKRGCGEICPDGCLTAGPGSRFILANTEALHEKNAELSDRIKQLEDALADFAPSHRLLTPELLAIKASIPGTSSPVLSSSPKDDSRTLRTSISALSLRDNVLVQQPPYRPAPGSVAPSLSAKSLLHPHVIQLSRTFPFPWAMDVEVRKKIRDSLPSIEEATRISKEAQANALWQFNMDLSETFLTNLINTCYTVSIESLSPRRLALLLMILSIGSLVDLSQTSQTHSVEYGEAYHSLARAAVCEIPLMEEPDFDVLHTLFFMLWYHLIFSDNNKAVGYAWNLMGFVAKLAQGLALHRTSPHKGKFIPEESEKRSMVFWELLNLDCRMSLSLGRPASLSLAHVNTPPPSFSFPGPEKNSYHEWKFKFYLECLNPIMDTIMITSEVPYMNIIDLDIRVRDFQVPMLLRNTRGDNRRFLVMQRALVSTGKDIALLQLHRNTFTQAMNAEPFDFNHVLAPSVVATYISTDSLILAVIEVYDKEPELSARFLYFWWNSYSAAVTLALIIFRAPSNPIAQVALQSLENVLLLFRRASERLLFSQKSLPVLGRLYKHAVQCIREAQKERTLPSGMNDIVSNFSPSVFSTAHPHLCGVVRSMLATTPSVSIDGSIFYRQQTNTSSGTYLPDIYNFSTAGMSVTDRYASKAADLDDMPFLRAAPRVEGTEQFKFDYGALDAHLQETSFMAWF